MNSPILNDALTADQLAQKRILADKIRQKAQSLALSERNPMRRRRVAFGGFDQKYGSFLYKPLEQEGVIHL